MRFLKYFRKELTLQERIDSDEYNSFPLGRVYVKKPLEMNKTMLAYGTIFWTDKNIDMFHFKKSNVFLHGGQTDVSLSKAKNKAIFKIFYRDLLVMFSGVVGKHNVIGNWNYNLIDFDILTKTGGDHVGRGETHSLDFDLVANKIDKAINCTNYGAEHRNKDVNNGHTFIIKTIKCKQWGYFETFGGSSTLDGLYQSYPLLEDGEELPVIYLGSQFIHANVKMWDLHKRGGVKTALLNNARFNSLGMKMYAPYVDGNIKEVMKIMKPT